MRCVCIYAKLFAAIKGAQDKKAEKTIVDKIREAVDLGYKEPETFVLPAKITKNQVANTK